MNADNPASTRTTIKAPEWQEQLLTLFLCHWRKESNVIDGLLQPEGCCLRIKITALVSEESQWVVHKIDSQKKSRMYVQRQIAELSESAPTFKPSPTI